MFGSTVRKGLPALRYVITLLMVFLMALLIIATCVSCRDPEKHGDLTDTRTETKTGAKMSNPNIKTTTTPANLTQEMYDKIELGMTYEQVKVIIGQDPNKTEQVEDPVKPGSKVLKCTWTGAEGTGKYQTPPEISINLDAGKAYAKESSSL